MTDNNNNILASSISGFDKVTKAQFYERAHRTSLVMATLNLSTNGPSISRSYQSVINSSPSGPASKSPTYGQWAVFSVSAPLVNAFQQDTGGKESLLKVQSTGGNSNFLELSVQVLLISFSEGELVDLIDEFSDGRVQFAFVKVNDPNTTLPKYVLIAWCGEGVPERTKGYFTSHLAAVSKTLHVGGFWSDFLL